MEKLFHLKRKIIRNSQILFLLLTYFTFSFVTLALWEHKGINQVTGDEPHYLVMSNGIAKYKTFEQTKPYKEEFNTRRIYAPGLALKDENPSPKNTHALLGQNGLFNVHNIGLPLLLAIPFAIGGVIGAKVFMIVVGGLIIFNFWDFASQYCNNKNIICAILLPLTISQPILFSSNQIYPELVAALLTILTINMLTKYRDSNPLNNKDSTIIFFYSKFFTLVAIEICSYIFISVWLFKLAISFYPKGFKTVQKNNIMCSDFRNNINVLQSFCIQ